MLVDDMAVAGTVKNLTGGGSSEAIDGIPYDVLDEGGTRQNFDYFLYNATLSEFPKCDFTCGVSFYMAFGKMAIDGSDVLDLDGVVLGASSGRIGGYQIFGYCKNFQTIKNANLSAFYQLDYAFTNCSSLTTLDCTISTTHDVTLDRFGGGTSLEALPFTSDDLVAVSSMQYFMQKTPLTTVPDLYLPKVNYVTGIFAYCTSLTEVGDLTVYTSNLDYVCPLCTGCTSLEKIGLISSTTADVFYMSSTSTKIFNGTAALTEFSFSGIKSGTSNAIYKITCNASDVLTADTIVGLIDCIIARDDTYASKGYSLVIGSTNLAKLDDDTIAAATEKNIAIS